MKYGDTLIKEILAELEKTPIVRQVCIKFGIDHSTFYRWLLKHPTFLKQVMFSLNLGRRKMSDTSESVIMSGVQNKDFKSAAFWLVHNEPRYMSSEKGRHFQTLVDHDLRILNSDFPSDCMTFEKVYPIFQWTEQAYGSKIAREMMGPIIELLCHNDHKIVDIFYATYAEWEKDKALLDEKIQKSGIECPDEEDK